MRRVTVLVPLVAVALLLLTGVSAHAQATRTWVSGVGDDDPRDIGGLSSWESRLPHGACSVRIRLLVVIRRPSEGHIETRPAKSGAVIRNVCGLATLNQLRSAYNELLISAVESPSYNLMGGVIPQIARPSLLHGTFRENEAIENGAARAALMGTPRAAMCFDMLIYKEPGNEIATPWHQDLFGRGCRPEEPDARSAFNSSVVDCT